MGTQSAVGGGLVVVELFSGLSAREPPVDRRPFLVDVPVPSLGFPLQDAQFWNSTPAQTLPRVQAEFDLRLVEQLPCLGV